MSKLSLMKFVVRPGEVAAGIRRLGGRGAVLHGVRRLGAAMERALLGPAQLRINPMGAVCNHACGMCWLQHLPPGEKEREFANDRASAMNLDEYRALFDGMPAGLTEVNVVGGGEPLVHPQCIDIMREVKRRKVRGYLMTNGSLLREDKAKALVDMGWELTRFSVHAGDAATYRAIHGVDHFDRLRENVATLDRLRRQAGAKERIGVYVHNVIQRENLDAIPAMFEFAEQVGADRIAFEIVFAMSPHVRLTKIELGRAADVLAACARTARTPSNALFIADELRREQADAPAQPFPKPQPVAFTPPPPPAPISPTAAAAPAAPATPAARTEPTVVLEPPYRPANRCSVGFDSSMVTAQGQVLPCCFSNEVMGNVRERPFRDIWYGELYSAFRRRLISGQFADYCSKVRCKLKSFLHD